MEDKKFWNSSALLKEQENWELSLKNDRNGLNYAENSALQQSSC